MAEPVDDPLEPKVVAVPTPSGSRPRRRRPPDEELLVPAYHVPMEMAGSPAEAVRRRGGDHPRHVPADRPGAARRAVLIQEPRRQERFHTRSGSA